MNMLRAQLYEYYEDQKKAEMDRFYGAKSENGWGSQIRSYVFCPYTMVKDLRTEYETSDVNAVMDGAIQPFVEAWLQMKAKERLAASGSRRKQAWMTGISMERRLGSRNADGTRRWRPRLTPRSGI